MKIFLKNTNTNCITNLLLRLAQEARKVAEKKGFEIDEENWTTEVAFGGKYKRARPSVGKSNSFSVALTKNGKPQRKHLHFQVYGMESGNFELNAYVS